MLLLISAITFNAWAEDDFHKEWRRTNRELDIDELMKGVDHDKNVIDLRNQAHKGIDPETLGSSHTETTNVEHSVKDKRPQELQSKGREAMSQNQEVTNLLGDLQKNTDRSQPGVDAVFKKAEKIVEQRTNLGDSLSRYLKEKYDIDIGCTSTPGNQDIPKQPLVLGIELGKVRNETYEPQYCEHLLNTYDCTTDVNINCLKPGLGVIDLNVVNSNIGYSKNNNIIHIDHRYEAKVETISHTFVAGGKANSDFGAIYSTSYRRYYRLAKAELKIIFDIPFNLDNLAELALLNLNFSHIIWVKLNGSSVYPRDWSELSFKYSDSRQIGHHSNDYEERPAMETGRGRIAIGRQTSPTNHIGGIDLKPFVKAGHNELVIHGASIEKSHITLDIRAQEKTCLKWSERWVETCTLQPS